MKDMLEKTVIENNIKKEYSVSCQVLDEVDSTNNRMKEYVYNDVYDYNLVVSDAQSMGRGRRGRVFDSPKGTGIYMSILIPVKYNMGNILLITSAAAVAVVRAVRALTSLRPEIKWVNDIYVNKRKVCGILAEAVNNRSGDMYVVLGIGVNVTTDKELFSEAAKNIAGALFEGRAPVTRNRIIAQIVNEFFEIYNNINDREYMKDYRKYSMVLGRPVRYNSNEGWVEGTAVDIDDYGGLIVEVNGNKVTLNTGEITLRLN